MVSVVDEANFDSAASGGAGESTGEATPYQRCDGRAQGCEDQKRHDRHDPADERGRCVSDRREEGGEEAPHDEPDYKREEGPNVGGNSSRQVNLRGPIDPGPTVGRANLVIARRLRIEEQLHTVRGQPAKRCFE